MSGNTSSKPCGLPSRMSTSPTLSPGLRVLVCISLSPSCMYTPTAPSKTMKMPLLLSSPVSKRVSFGLTTTCQQCAFSELLSLPQLTCGQERQLAQSLLRVPDPQFAGIETVLADKKMCLLATDSRTAMVLAPMVSCETIPSASRLCTRVTVPKLLASKFRA